MLIGCTGAPPPRCPPSAPIAPVVRDAGDHDAAHPGALVGAGPRTRYQGALAEHVQFTERDAGAGVPELSLWLGFHGSRQGTDLGQLVLRLERDVRPTPYVLWQREGVTEILDGRPLPALLQRSCDHFAIGLHADHWGEESGARIDIACRTGEDMFTASSIAILVADVQPYRILWVGTGDSLSNENGACIAELRTTYEVQGPRLIQKITETTRRNVDGTCMPGRKQSRPAVKQRAVVHPLSAGG